MSLRAQGSTPRAGWWWAAGCAVLSVACGSGTIGASGDDGTASGDNGGNIAIAGNGTSSSGSATGTSSGNASSSSSGGSAGGSSSGVATSAGPVGCDGGLLGTPSGVVFSVDVALGPQRQFQPPGKPTAISPYVYGINASGIWETTTHWGLARYGGDATTDWNWTNNYSNSGSDYCFWQGQEDGGNALAGTIADGSTLSIGKAQSLGIAFLATVPIVDHVSATYSNNTGINNLCPGSPSCKSPSPYAVNSGNLSFASTNASSAAFVANKPTKGSAFCTCQPGASCASGCAPSTTGTVYQDEYANYLKTKYGTGGAPVFLMLDNEPNYWPGTHPEIWPYTGTPGCGTSGTVSFDDVVTRNTTYATAVKKVWQDTKVFGPVVAQDGIIYGGDYSDPHLPTTFADYYLGQMATASVSAGTPLIDAFDFHYYTSGGSADQCVQVPRMFWDPSFTDFTAAQTDSIDYGWSGPSNYFDTNLYPRQMIPRIAQKIANAYAGKATAAPGMSISEYNAGCEDVIQGGVAEADLLGVFGREGVYAAMAWPLKTVTSSNKLVNYLIAAYDLYRNFDGKGAVVGDTTVLAKTSDDEKTSVYAFAQSNDASRVDLVAVNKTSAALPVTVQIANAPGLKTATAYELAGGTIGVTAASGTAPALDCTCTTCSVTYTLPAMSATTIALR